MKLTDKITLTNEDNMELMARTPDKYYDLAIVDPPYGINIAARGNIGSERGLNQSGSKTYSIQRYKKSSWDTSAPAVEYFNELLRVSKNQIIWGANHFISRIPFDSSCWLVWDKDNSGNYADCELAWTSFKTAVKKFQWRWNGMLQQDMKNKESRIHPTQKPVKLYEMILQSYAQPDFKVLDTHAGSFSIGIAAHHFGCELTACEIDKDYFEAAVKRFRLETAQQKLFSAA